MKKQLVLFLALALCLGLTACGDTESDDTQSGYETVMDMEFLDGMWSIDGTAKLYFDSTEGFYAYRTRWGLGGRGEFEMSEASGRPMIFFNGLLYNFLLRDDGVLLPNRNGEGSGLTIHRNAPGQKTVNLILAGIMVSSLFSAGTSYIKLVAAPGSKLPEITYWLMGSLSGTRGVDIRFAILPMALGLIPLLLIRWRLNLLTLGEEEARALGINTALLRLIVVVCATLVTAASVSVSGLIGWVGLVIPHLCRRYIGNDYRKLLPASMLFGATFLLLVDNISRNLLAVEIPIGILTAFIGAPFFIYLMHQKGGGV